jgi:hypothetical protein
MGRGGACASNTGQVGSVLWSIHTNTTKPTGETPFFLVYGAEVVLPTDIKFGSPRVLAFNELRQEDLLKDHLLLLEEARYQVALRAAQYQQGLRHYHSSHVRARTLEVRDLVLRRILSREGLHKLSPMWEGPFKVTHISMPAWHGWKPLKAYRWEIRGTSPT